MIIPGDVVAYSAAFAIFLSVISIIFLSWKEVSQKNSENEIAKKYTVQKIIAGLILAFAIWLLW